MERQKVAMRVSIADLSAYKLEKPTAARRMKMKMKLSQRADHDDRSSLPFIMFNIQCVLRAQQTTNKNVCLLAL